MIANHVWINQAYRTRCANLHTKSAIITPTRPDTSR